MKTQLVAELSANHGGSLETALATVRAAAEAGADAIKLQTYTADTMTLPCDTAPYRISQGTIWDGMNLHALYREAATPWEWHAPIMEEAHRCGIECFSTPFDLSSVDFLVSLGVARLKIASFELNDIPLLAYAASQGLPMILSSGVSDRAGIAEAIETCKASGCTDLTLLKCTSSYPAPLDEANLRTIADIPVAFGVKAGLSDHTMGPIAALGAVALGATMIEKHFILDRAIGGPDASFSMEPAEFSSMVRMVRDLESALGRIDYDLTPKAMASAYFRRSLIVARDIRAGEVITPEHVRSLRPAIGSHPRFLPRILGKRAARDMKFGDPFPEDGALLDES